MKTEKKEYIEYWNPEINKWVKKLPNSFKDKLVKTRRVTKEDKLK